VAGLRFEPPKFEGDPKTYPLLLQVYESAAFGDGRGANVPWLQELPDPMTTVVWGSWVELNPQTAAKLGVAEGDSVLVGSARDEVLVPVFIHPGLSPDVAAMPIGQGHTQYGQYASNRGANPLVLLAPAVETASGAWAYSATRVQVAIAAGAQRLVKAEGTSTALPGKAFFE
jgi:menaquinone reductase, molybdopterin-binding-like subunit